MRSIAAVIAVLSLSACGPGPGGTVCTEEFAFGLNVTVTDAATGERVCDAVVTATEGDFSETLEVLPGDDCVYVGAGERAGTYRVEAAKAGFASAVQEDVVVGEDECHVVGEQVELALTAG